eukprot:11975038-Alexandrium_andersonii.AAC.1
MSASLVVSEMCIRDSALQRSGSAPLPSESARAVTPSPSDEPLYVGTWDGCLLYTSDAADDM